jgi:hypothetical protein
MRGFGLRGKLRESLQGVAGPEVGLATHIEDVINVLEREDLCGVVLVSP